MTDENKRAIAAALEDFRRARRQAAMQEILARVTGEPVDLLSFDEVRAKLKASGGISRGLRDIPLDAIVGSVGRYKDFTRGFLPRLDNDEYRWARVKAATTELTGVPPIEVYQIGDAYFVLDGNHRVSVARELGESYVEAYVTEFKSRVPLSPEDKFDDLILKAEYADFLEQTRLDQFRLGADLRLTEPGRYWELKTQIDALHFMMSQDQERDKSYQEAVCFWYDNIYLPMIRIIRERGILRDFPDRTETDLYLWIFHHRAELEKRLGWNVDLETAATDLVTEHSEKTGSLVTRLEEKLVAAIVPDPLESGPAPGRWRQERLEARPQDRLFSNILVPLTGTEQSWSALDQALLIAEREKSQLLGLHVVSVTAEVEGETAQAVKAEFNRRCQEAGIQGELSIDAGTISRQISDRARWVDLVVLHLAHPPGNRVLERLSSGFRTLLHRSPRPVLTVPGNTSRFDKALLAYDGSPKAREGLFVATYLAGKWQISLTILTAATNGQSEAPLTEAKDYLDKRGVTAEFIYEQGMVAEATLKVAAEKGCDFTIMGGYGRSSVMEAVLGSSIDQLLRESRLPALICR